MHKRKLLLILTIVMFASLIHAQGTDTSKAFLNANLFSSLIGGLIGGILGVIATLWTSYYGPKKLIEFKEEREENKLNGPRKKLLSTLLNDPRFPDGRKIETLSMVTGTTPEECRRLLVEVNARGIKLKSDQEGWVLIANKPINEE